MKINIYKKMLFCRSVRLIHLPASPLITSVLITNDQEAHLINYFLLDHFLNNLFKILRFTDFRRILNIAKQFSYRMSF